MKPTQQVSAARHDNSNRGRGFVGRDHRSSETPPVTMASENLRSPSPRSREIVRRLRENRRLLFVGQLGSKRGIWFYSRVSDLIRRSALVFWR